jgi:predicted DNA-binding protein (MmcQ/YjbR family)
MSLPGVHEGIKWEHDLCYMVAEKMFCVTGLEENAAVSLKVGDDEFEELCEREGIGPAPYLARNKWIMIEKRSALKPKEWEHYVRQSYELIKSKLPKKIRDGLG